MGNALNESELKRMRKLKPNEEHPSNEECQQILTKAFEEYHGDCTVLEAAVGALFVGRWLGWKALRILHSNATYGKYERALGVRFNQILPETTHHSRLLSGMRMMDKESFWKLIVSGKVDRRKGKEFTGVNPAVT